MDTIHNCSKWLRKKNVQPRDSLRYCCCSHRSIHVTVLSSLSTRNLNYNLTSIQNDSQIKNFLQDLLPSITKNCPSVRTVLGCNNLNGSHLENWCGGQDVKKMSNLAEMLSSPSEFYPQELKFRAQPTLSSSSNITSDLSKTHLSQFLWYLVMGSFQDSVSTVWHGRLNLAKHWKTWEKR